MLVPARGWGKINVKRGWDGLLGGDGWQGWLENTAGVGAIFSGSL
ncbi:hypothetical protein EIKCOROL_01247 [Eikenella corrodens ATCC 23834]|uniref:Uncharacterized protein n=1 Tax=Eikenella corrodens ATCC 23834 TaxID=546274 RepID=C0DV58_EIKCO|nr:hypothetical protein EIKCOROL_01247 [Eikenella corrodens ATCC 23834]